MAGQRATTLLCSQARCRTPVLTVDGDDLVVRARHHGEHHENRIAIVEILENALRSGLSPLLRRQLREMLSDD
jgi:hypothetical protein